VCSEISIESAFKDSVDISGIETNMDLNHSLNDETEVYLQNTEILPNLELESKMHIDSNDIVEDTSSQPNIEKGQLTTESKDDISHVSVDQTMSCCEPQRAVNESSTISLLSICILDSNSKLGKISVFCR
jgi:hypothetical protein